MRSLWKGAISFGLVNIPVKLYKATESRDVQFHQLHRPCHTPIRYRRFCPTCGREAPTEEIARAYEYTGGNYVVVEDDELAALPLNSERAVEILDFVRLEEIDPIYFERGYFLEPADGGAKAYALLRHALRRTGRVGLAKVALRSKESLATIRVYTGAGQREPGAGQREPGEILVMETMYYPDEVRSHAQMESAYRDVPVNERELGMAIQLIDSLSVSFEPAKYRDEYRDALLKVIEDKARGEEMVAPPAPEPARVVDLMQALEESLRVTRERRERERAGTGAGVSR